MGFNKLFLQLFLQMVILIELIPSSAPILTSPSLAIAKPGCDDRCGDVSIPFPFGTQEGCYLNKDFFINCSKSSDINAPQPLLRTGNVTVTNISLEGQLRLLQFVGHDCYYQNGSRSSRNHPRMWLASGLTFNSTVNKFTTVGCDTYSIVEGVTAGSIYATGCVSFCARKEDVKDGPCSGLGCCQTSIPPEAWKINVSLTSYRNHTYVWNFNPCSYAFVVEDGAFQFFADNLTNLDKVTRLPVVADWTIDNMTCEAAQRNTTSYACSSTNSQCEEQKGLGYRCLCKEGFEGNPYLPDGCKDIDECKDINRYKCAKNSACHNTLGNYTCPCRKGYHGDGREGGDGCSPNWSMIVPGFYISYRQFESKRMIMEETSKVNLKR